MQIPPELSQDATDGISRQSLLPDECLKRLPLPLCLCHCLWLRLWHFALWVSRRILS